MPQPSLYEMLTGNFASGLNIHQVSEQEQLMLSVLDNVQRILNTRAGTLTHLPDYGLPDMSKIIHGLPGTAHSLMGILSNTLLKYEPRIKKVKLALLPAEQFGSLRYALEVELYASGLVRFGTEFIPDGRIVIHHLKQQQLIS